MRDLATPSSTLTTALAAACLLFVADGNRESLPLERSGLTDEPPHLVASSPVVEIGMEPLRREQVTDALDQLTGPTPASLGRRLEHTMQNGIIKELSSDEDAAISELADRLHVTIMASEGHVQMSFYGGADVGAVVDEILTAKWGRPLTHDDSYDCSNWIDARRQWQLHRCTQGGYGVRHQQKLEWSAYVTPEQWIGAQRGKLGFEPFRLIGGTRSQLAEALGRTIDDESSVLLALPGIDPGFSGSMSLDVELEGDRIVAWRAHVTADPLPFAKLLVERYGKPIWPRQECCYTNEPAGTTGHEWHELRHMKAATELSGYLTWEVNGLEIQAELSRYMFSLEVADLAYASRRDAERWRALRPVTK